MVFSEIFLYLYLIKGLQNTDGTLKINTAGQAAPLVDEPGII